MEFLIQCKLNFCNRLQAFHLDTWKVGFALSFLKGIALAWFKPNLLNSIPGAEPAWANDYSEFVIELMMNFGSHDPVGNAEHQLDNLSMKDVHSYGECALCHIFYNRLPDHIKDKITHIGKPPCLIDLYTMAQGIDACYWEHKSDIIHQIKTNPQPSLSNQSLSEVSSSRQSGNSSSTTSFSSTGKDSSMLALLGILGKDGKLTAAECLCHMKTPSVTSVGSLAIQPRTTLGPHLAWPKPALPKQPP
ncbi:hypothetical protein ID866_12250 [Astraeus odoratus]|nr:hypothetical protein ID866_12250 [Astraeus odoratus]